MCGIVGYVGGRDAAQVIFEGLRRLEYRGYDSAGLAVVNGNGRFDIRRDAGKIQQLGELIDLSPVHGHVGIGHTRWATHGPPTQLNAHPHTSMNGQVVIVHNGIVENFMVLREELEEEGVEFSSDTDSEVIAQLIQRLMSPESDLETAVRQTFQQINGANAIVALSLDQPDRLVCARLGNAGGIAIGIGQDEMFVASDIPAILEYTRDIAFLDSGNLGVISRGAYRITDLDGKAVDAVLHNIPWDPVSAVKGEYRHFMQKEIFEQPRAIVDTMGGRILFESGQVRLPHMNLTPEVARGIHKLYIVACGTSYYSGLVGKYLFETIARLPTEVEYASEFRYYNPIIDENTAVLSITQSGETADTLAASEQARHMGATLWAIVNVQGSQAMRSADGYIAMHAGPEIGVASTKAFTTSIVDQYLLACELAELRGTLSGEHLQKLLDDLARLPDLAGRILDRDAEYEALAGLFFKAENFLFLGRGINYPIAMEGALKLKEISYIHAEGYPAGEMKHGPIALIDESMPVVAIVTKDELYEKMLSQVKQAKARGGVVIALASEGDERIKHEADHVIYVPEAPPLLAPVVNVIPLQLLSYHIAERRGCDVDQPRNLAKSVTVE